MNTIETKAGLKVIRNLVLITVLSLATFFDTNAYFWFQEEQKEDTTGQTKYKDLPLKAERTLTFNTNEGTWLSIDISPDGQTIAFDMLGDLYTMPFTGGKATWITDGMAYDTHPRFSPDGKSIVFTSDRSGNDNIWTMELESKETKQITKSQNENFQSAEWSPDGEYLVVSRGRRAYKLYMYHKTGGGGFQLIKQPSNLKTIEPTFSPDGRFIYYSRRNGAWNYNAQLPQYQIGTYDRENGQNSVITSRYGSAFTPTLSPDGKWLVYGSRYEDQTGLVLRNLASGDEKWLAYPVQRDEQESIAPLGVLPAMSFTPDSKELVASYGGKLYRIPVAGGDAIEIPLDVDVELEMGPRVKFDYPISDNSDMIVTQIRDAVPSPDGSKLAFTSLNRLYVMDIPDGEPKRLTSMEMTEAQPTWSPDGKMVAFVTWSDSDGGSIYKVNVDGRPRPEKISTEAAIYGTPSWSTDNRIVYTRGSAQNMKDAAGPFTPNAASDLYWVSANGGETHWIMKTNGRGNPHFVKGSDRIYLSSFSGLSSVRWDGTDEKQHVAITGITTFGTNPAEHHAPDHGSGHIHGLLYMEDARENNPPTRAAWIRMAPEGDKALAQVNNDIYVVTVPKLGQTPTISVANPASSQFPSWKLTEIGGQFPAWSHSAKKVHWSIGNAHFIYDLDEAKAFKDSVDLAKKEKEKAEKAKSKEEKEKEKKEKEEAEKDKTDEEKEADKKKKEEENKAYEPIEFRVEITAQKDVPEGRALLKGARIVTMNGDEVIENGDVLIENARIKAIGPSGSLNVPRRTQTIDVSGKTIIPGMVDTHAHMWPAWGIHKNQVWIYAANLAYGVTTTRDPQTATTDVLTYSDMVETGQIVGPRVYSTGPGVGFWMYNMKSLEHTRKVLKQYSEYYNTKTIKMYLTGNRKHRQWIIQASREQKLMPTTEGGLDFKHNMANLVDGYPGHEHALPIHPLYKDVTKVVADSKMAYTPTLLVAYGGPWAENYFYSRENPYHDKKLSYFTPYNELAPKSRRRPGWFMDEEHVFQKHAEGVNSVVEQGGLAGVGSHGQLQGLGYHWELWAMASGGMTPMNALKTATILGAEAIGLEKDLGSLEVGKLADLIILDKNPLEDIRNTNTILQVMKNGRLYDGNTLDEVYPRKKKADPFWWHTSKPEGLPGIKK